MTEINLFTKGDSNNISTWSNVPFLFAKALEKKGYVVHKHCISSPHWLIRLFNSISIRISHYIFHTNSIFEFHNTWLHRKIIDFIIKRSTNKYPNSKLNIFLTSEYLNKFSSQPNILFCDWSHRMYVERGRKAYWYERKRLDHEDKVIKKADAVYTLFPKCKEKMESLYGRKVDYLNRNVINSTFIGRFDIKETITNRLKSNSILFIGNFKYRSGALQLIQSVDELSQEKNNLEIHVIGMTEKELGKHENVVCHGYLHKDNEAERNLYYELLLSCRCLVNPTKGWAGYSSCVEAMYYGCPIIISPYDDFTAEFGDIISFGYYCDENNLKDKIKQMFNSINYPSMCTAAHMAVKDYTWDNYMDAFIQSLLDKGLLK